MAVRRPLVLIGGQVNELPATDSLPGSGGPAAWGAISGTLSDQTDLQTALNAKANTAGGARDNRRFTSKHKNSLLLCGVT